MPPSTSLPFLSRLRESRARFAAQFALALEHARSSLGIRRGHHSPRCYYKELTSERLARALATRSGSPGFKDYRVTFPDGAKLLARCTRTRCYADLMGPEMLTRYQRIATILRPGSRILDIPTPPMTTGYTGDWLARMAGPSGSVVSLIPDEQGSRFAERRYAQPNLSIEHVPADAIIQSLAGETNGAFHAIIHLGLPTDAPHRDALMKELWRVLAPGGWMLAGVLLTDDPADEAIQSLRRHLAGIGQVVESSDPNTGPVLDVLLRKQVAEVEAKP